MNRIQVPEHSIEVLFTAELIHRTSSNIIRTSIIPDERTHESDIENLNYKIEKYFSKVISKLKPSAQEIAWKNVEYINANSKNPEKMVRTSIYFYPGVTKENMSNVDPIIDAFNIAEYDEIKLTAIYILHY